MYKFRIETTIQNSFYIHFSTEEGLPPVAAVAHDGKIGKNDIMSNNILIYGQVAICHGSWMDPLPPAPAGRSAFFFRPWGKIKFSMIGLQVTWPGNVYDLLSI